jgi:hypothetical protein
MLRHDKHSATAMLGSDLGYREQLRRAGVRATEQIREVDRSGEPEKETAERVWGEQEQDKVSSAATVNRSPQG